MQKILSVDNLIFLENLIARDRMSGGRFMFRGQSNASWPIQTTLYRLLGESYENDNVWCKYLECYERFKSFVLSKKVLTYKPNRENIDFYILTMARHLEFPCHLIDWTASLKTAILFSCSENENIDGSLWILSTNQPINKSPLDISPFDVEEPLLICKEYELVTPSKGLLDIPLGRLRRFRQNGFMSIIPRKYLSNDFEALIDKKYALNKIIISANAKRLILEYLHKQGVTLNHLMANNITENSDLPEYIKRLTNELKTIITK